VFTARYALNSYVREAVSLLGAFAKLRKGTVNFVMFVCPSVRPHGTAGLPLGRFKRNLTFEHCSKIFQVSLKSDNNNGHFKTNVLFYYISLISCYNEKFFKKNCRESQNTHFILNNFFFRNSCLL